MCNLALYADLKLCCSYRLLYVLVLGLLEATVVIEAVAVVTSQDRGEVDAGDIDQFQTKRRSLRILATCQQALYRAISNKYSAVYR